MSETKASRLPGGFSLPPFGIHQVLAIVIVCVALWSLGTLWLGMQATGQWIGSWQGDVRLHVYLPTQHKDRLQALGEGIEAIPGVGGIRIVERSEAVAWLHSWLGSTGLSDEEMAIRLPLSIEVMPATDAGEFIFDDIRDEARRFGAEVNDEESYLLQARVWLDDIRAISWFGTAILALAMAIIISNTLRMILLARADEVQLMRLLGAREWFVRMPFILEGMLIGAGSGLLAWLLCWPLIIGTSEWLAGFQVNVSGFSILLPLLFVGAVIGCIGALIATAKLVTGEVKASKL